MCRDTRFSSFECIRILLTIHAFWCLQLFFVVCCYILNPWLHQKQLLFSGSDGWDIHFAYARDCSTRTSSTRSGKLDGYVKNTLNYCVVVIVAYCFAVRLTGMRFCLLSQAAWLSNPSGTQEEARDQERDVNRSMFAHEAAYWLEHISTLSNLIFKPVVCRSCKLEESSFFVTLTLVGK